MTMNLHITAALALTFLLTGMGFGTDADLKTSYSAVHDLFEELAHLLPRKE
jgi:hypothetical protein